MQLIVLSPKTKALLKKGQKLGWLHLSEDEATTIIDEVSTKMNGSCGDDYLTLAFIRNGLVMKRNGNEKHD